MLESRPFYWEDPIMRPLLHLILFLAALISITACGVKNRVMTNFPPTVTPTSVVELPASTATPQINHPLPAATETQESNQAAMESTVQTWTGTIKSLPAGAQFNDYFEYGTNTCGIDGSTDEINQLITQYRDSGKMVKIHGVISTDVPDVNGCQIRVTKVEE
jgi:predicted small lipoprotein YifL